jgi:hypothetical protein
MLKQTQAKTQKNPPKTQNIPGKTQNIPAKTQKNPPKTQNIPGKTQKNPPKTQNIPAKTQKIPPKTQNIQPKTQNNPLKTQNIQLKSQNIQLKSQNIQPKTQNIQPKTQNLPVNSQNLPVNSQNLPVNSQNLPVNSQNLPVKPIIKQSKKICRVRREILTTSFPVIFIRHTTSNTTWLTPTGIVETTNPQIMHGWYLSTEETKRQQFSKPDFKTTDYMLVAMKPLKIGQNKSIYILSDDTVDDTLYIDHKTVEETSNGDWAWLTCKLRDINNLAYGTPASLEECYATSVGDLIFNLSVNIFTNGSVMLYDTFEKHLSLCDTHLGWSSTNTPISFTTVAV